MKVCPVCKINKKDYNFYFDKRGRPHGYCKECNSIKGKERRVTLGSEAILLEKKRKHDRYLEREDQIVPTVSEKKCPRCKQIKSALEFNKSLKNNDGLSSYCKFCDKTRRFDKCSEEFKFTEDLYNNLLNK